MNENLWMLVLLHCPWSLSCFTAWCPFDCCEISFLMNLLSSPLHVADRSVGWQHGPDEGLQQRYQSVSWGQATRRGYVDEGRPPLPVVQWAVIRKIAQVSEIDRKHDLIVLSDSAHTSDTEAYTCQRLLNKQHPSLLLLWAVWKQPSCQWLSRVPLVLRPRSSDLRDSARARLCLCSLCSSPFAPTWRRWSLWLCPDVQQTGTHKRWDIPTITRVLSYGLQHLVSIQVLQHWGHWGHVLRNIVLCEYGLYK